MDERQRPLGVPALEDKIVQRSVVEVLSAIYETDFLGFSASSEGWHVQWETVPSG
jgi:retron-type reverse transcriptase